MSVPIHRRKCITNKSLGSEGSELFGRDLDFPPAAWERPTVGSHAITHSSEKHEPLYPPPPPPFEPRGRTHVRTESGSSDRSHNPAQRDRSHTPTQRDYRTTERGIARALLRNHGLLGDVATTQPQNMTESMSPSSSPRLPSPPPFPEVQIGPKSPGMNVTQGIAHLDIEDSAALDSGSTRRIRRGTPAAVMAAGPPLIPLAQVRWNCFYPKSTII